MICTHVPPTFRQEEGEWIHHPSTFRQEEGEWIHHHSTFRPGALFVRVHWQPGYAVFPSVAGYLTEMLHTQALGLCVSHV